MEFRKSLAKYYQKWYQDCLTSADYLKAKRDNAGALMYDESAAEYLRIINENAKAIEFFSQGDNAFLKDSALPEEFRGYK